MESVRGCPELHEVDGAEKRERRVVRITFCTDFMPPEATLQSNSRQFHAVLGNSVQFQRILQQSSQRPRYCASKPTHHTLCVLFSSPTSPSFEQLF